jgi:hypothetical protein
MCSNLLKFSHTVSKQQSMLNINCKFVGPKQKAMLSSTKYVYGQRKRHFETKSLVNSNIQRGKNKAKNLYLWRKSTKIIVCKISLIFPKVEELSTFPKGHKNLLKMLFECLPCHLGLTYHNIGSWAQFLSPNFDYKLLVYSPQMST